MNSARHSLERDYEHQAPLFALAATLYIVVAFTVDLITRERALNATALFLYILLSLALALRYIQWMHSSPMELPLRRELPRLLLSLPLLLGVAFVLNDINPPYAYLIGLEGYYSLAPRKRSWGIAWITVLMGLVLVTSAWIWGWASAAARLLQNVPTYLLLIVVLELLINQRKHRDQMASLLSELSEANEQLQDHVIQAETLAVTHERTRIAREIHDTLGHTMTALDVQLELLARLPPDQVETREDIVRQARNLVKEGLVEVRRAVKALHPIALETLSPTEAIAHLVTQFEETHRIETTWQVLGESNPPSFSLIVPLYRAVQESLTNVARHANASRVAVTLRLATDTVELNIRDNGRTYPGDIQFGYGLQGLKERAEVLGGEFQAAFHPSGGFQVVMRLPRCAADHRPVTNNRPQKYRPVTY